MIADDCDAMRENLKCLMCTAQCLPPTSRASGRPSFFGGITRIYLMGGAHDLSDTVD